MSISSPEKKISPMMTQWYKLKKKAGNAILLFRLGDFYECFYDDAKKLSQHVNVTLTQRQGIPMSGIPAHTAESYIEKLIAKGLIIAIAEQIEDPKKVKGIVKRDITQIISPGSHTSTLSKTANNFFASIYIFNKTYAMALMDLSTGEFIAFEFHCLNDLKNELYRRSPSEILISEKNSKSYGTILENISQNSLSRLTEKDSWYFEYQSAFDTLKDHFGIISLDGFGFKGKPCSITCTGTLLKYVTHELNNSLSHVSQITFSDSSEYVSIDHSTQKNLEIIDPIQSGNECQTLWYHINHTKTPMGARLLKFWLTHPLKNISLIHERQNSVEEIQKHPYIADVLKLIRDLERLIVKVMHHKATPRDVVSLKYSLLSCKEIEKNIAKMNSPLLQSLVFPSVEKAIQSIEYTIVEEPPTKIGDFAAIKKGVNKELDSLRDIKSNSKAFLAKYQETLRNQLGISTLKIIFSKVFGYCIDVSRAQATKMPECFARRQTLANNERFTSSELKEYEEKIIHSESKILEIEHFEFEKLTATLSQQAQEILKIAKSIATIDAIYALGYIADKYRYTKPVINIDNALKIKKGRHPVLEKGIVQQSFIPNDASLCENLILITGPNMAGKSTYMRQIALITLLAQIGSFVPAEEVEIGVVDKIFSRIGASDDLSKGHSTFMVEMSETANILRSATKDSLIILDEIGRGTSTFDGVSIAWAVAENLIQKKCKTLFATHYWELTELESLFENVVNMHVAILESHGEITFLHKVVEGCTHKSYGIHVAKLAGIPSDVIQRAEKVLDSLNSKHEPRKGHTSPVTQQLQFFAEPKAPEKNPTLEAIKSIDIDHITPIDAIKVLYDLKSTLKK